MLLFIILGAVVLITVIVLGVLFYMLSKEGQKNQEQKAVPLTDLNQLKNEPPLRVPEEQNPKAPGNDDVIPAFVPKITLPTQEVRSPVEDDTYKKRIYDLEEELGAIKQKAEEQADVAREMIVNLTKENQTLKNQQSDLEESQQKLTQLEQDATGLKTENINLQTQLESANTKVRLLEEEMTAVKVKMTEEINQANAKAAELNNEKEALLSAPKADPSEALTRELEDLKTEQIQLKQKYEDLEKKSASAEAVAQELEALRSERLVLNQKYEDLEKANQQLKELNGQLTQKIDSLQYDMVKAKAQSSGTERINTNYKNQLEDSLKKVSAAQEAHEQLSLAKNKLEALVEEIKSRNEQLIQKDQLSQFELEKNRSRLVNLERENEELKNRIPQQNQQ